MNNWAVSALPRATMHVDGFGHNVDIDKILFFSKKGHRRRIYGKTRHCGSCQVYWRYNRMVLLLLIHKAISENIQKVFLIKEIITYGCIIERPTDLIASGSYLLKKSDPEVIGEEGIESIFLNNIIFESGGHRI